MDTHGSIEINGCAAGGCVSSGGIVHHGDGGSPHRNAVIRALSEEAQAAGMMIESMRSLFGDDDEIINTAVEGETGLHEALSSALTRLAEIDALNVSIGTMLSSLQQRRDRLSKQADGIRTAMCMAMEMGAIKKLELPLATVSLRSVAPAVEITDESAIPSVYWKPQPPKLDKRELLKALKEYDLPGACLTPPSTIISVRFA